MKTYIKLGAELEDLVELISNQKKHNLSLDASELYDEITKQLKNYPDKMIVSHLKYNIHPNKIERTSNFQFLINDSHVAIANKYF